MKTWYTLRYSRFVLLLALAINIEICLQSSTEERASTGGLDQNILTQHLKRLRESLRWIRSPTTRGRFRPWGGKRSPLRVRNVNAYQPLCSATHPNFDISHYTKCSGTLSKRDKFRPWGGKRSQVNPINWAESQTQGSLPVAGDSNSPINQFQRDSYSTRGRFIKRMPELASTDDSSDKYFEVDVTGKQNYPLDYSSEEEMIVGHGSDMRETIPDRFWVTKRQRFNPWGGKRSSWVGKRQDISTLPFDLFNTANKTNSAQPQSTIDGDSALSLNSNEFTRGKRDVTGQEKAEAEYDDRAANDYESPSAPDHPKVLLSDSSHGPSDSWGVFPGTIKRFPSALEEPTKRSFNPWAGKKRSDRETDLHHSLGSITYPLAGNMIMAWNTDNDLGKEPHQINEGTEDNQHTSRSDKRRSFHPWAGKRTLPVKELSEYWAKTPESFTGEILETKRTFNPWAGKRNEKIY